VPDLDRPAAVLALRDLALEVRVVERVVLDVHGQVALPLAQRDALGNGPAGERAAALEPEVEMQPAGVVALDDEDRVGAAARARERLRRPGRVALAPVGVEALAQDTDRLRRWLRARAAPSKRPGRPARPRRTAPGSVGERPPGEWRGRRRRRPGRAP